MFLRKIFPLCFILFMVSVFAQRKKTDTIYIYEKVIVYDTIYMEKSIKIKPVGPIFPALKVQEKEIRDISQYSLDKKEGEEILKKIPNSKFHYGIQAGIGFKNTDWAESIREKNQQFGQHLGIWISKSIIHPNFSLLLSAAVHQWNSTFNLDANKEETYLNGFYFSADQQPLLFQRFRNKHFEYVVQLKALYEWKNFRPFVSFAAHKNGYKMQFLVPENNVLSKLDDFKSNQISFGYSFGLQYLILNRFMIDLEYQHYKADHLSLKNSAFDFDIFKTNNTFAERKFTLGIAYQLSR